MYFEDLGADHFLATTRSASGTDNVWDDSDRAAPAHEVHFAHAVRALVRAGVLREDISVAVNAELEVRRDPAGYFRVRPTIRFYSLSLLLIDALFTEMQRRNFAGIAAEQELIVEANR